MSTIKKPQSSPAAAASKVVAAGSPQNSFSPKTITVPKVGQKEIPMSKDGTTMKPVDHSSADQKKDGLDKLNPHGSDEPSKEKTVKQSSIKPAGSIKVPDVGMKELPHAHGAAKPQKSVEAMSDDELVEALEAHLAKADGEEGVPKLEIELNEGGEMPPPPPPASNEPSMLPPPPPPASAPSSEPPPAESTAPMGGEPLPMAEEEKFDENGQPMMSMDEPSIPTLEAPPAGAGMPYAQVALVRELRATAAALRAGVKVDEKAQKDLMAKAARVLRANSKADATAGDDFTDFTEFLKRQAVSKDPQANALMAGLKSLSETVADLAKKVSAISTPAAPVAADKAPPFEKKDEKKDSEKVEEIMDKKEEKAEGVHFEVLQSLDALEHEGITAASVNCSLYAAGGVNPFWNVTVHGEPLARIYLQDQERPDEIKALFCSPMYGEALSKASEQVEGGLRKLLVDASARFFTLQLDKVEVAQKARDVATAEAKKLIGERLTTLTDRFLESMATASIGMDRNFFKGGNPLKHALAENMKKIGLPVAQTVEIIEAAFADASADYFKALAQKANELMAMEPVAFNQLRAAIIEAGTILPVVDEETQVTADAGKSMVQHLTEQSNAIAGVNMAVLGGDGEKLSEKEQLRRDLGFPRRS